MSGDSIILQLIHDRALVSYEGPIVTAANYELWVNHWFKQADALRVEFLNEGLMQTAVTIADIIAKEKIICKTAGYRLDVN